MKSKNSYNTKNLETLMRVIEVFADESFDLSAKGFLRAVETSDELSIEELLAILKPRDYDVWISDIQMNRICDRLRG